MATRTRTRGLLSAVVLALVVLVLYTFVKGYHDNTDLMLTVILVRLAAAIGVGVFIAVLVTLWQFAVKRTASFGAFVSASVFATSGVVIVLALINLFQRT